MPATAVCQAPDPADTLQQAKPHPFPLFTVMHDVGHQASVLPVLWPTHPWAFCSLCAELRVVGQQHLASSPVTSCSAPARGSGPQLLQEKISETITHIIQLHKAVTKQRKQLGKLVCECYVRSWVRQNQEDFPHDSGFLENHQRQSSSLITVSPGGSLLGLSRMWFGCGQVCTATVFEASRSACQRQLAYINLLNHFLCLVPNLVQTNDLCCFRLDLSLLITTLVQSLSQSSE